MKYAVVTEKTANNCPTHVPDLPARVAAGQPLVEIEPGINSALELPIEGPLEDNLVVPAATSIAEYTETIAA